MGGTAPLTVFLIVLAVSLFGFAVLADWREGVFRRLIFPAGFAGAGADGVAGLCAGRFRAGIVLCDSGSDAPVLVPQAIRRFRDGSRGGRRGGIFLRCRRRLSCTSFGCFAGAGRAPLRDLCGDVSWLGLWRAGVFRWGERRRDGDEQCRSGCAMAFTGGVHRSAIGEGSPAEGAFPAIVRGSASSPGGV